MWKSYLLFELYKKYLLSQNVEKEHILEIPLDDDEFEELRDRKKLSKYIKERISEDEVYYIMLDEVQFCEGFESVLNGLARKENLDIYVTGSNSKFLSSDILTEFRGRGDEIRVYPLSFSEYVSAFSGDKHDAWREYMMYGGLPLILSCNTDEQKSKYLTDLFKKTYIADVTERNGLREENVLDQVVDILASSIGSSLKYYYMDIGLRNARLNFRHQEPTHIMEI